MREKPLLLTATLLDAVQAIEISPRRMTVVVDTKNQLLGTLTDGDIRRHLLVGGSLNDLASTAMNKSPITALKGSPNTKIKNLMRLHNVIALPIVDAGNSYLDLVHLVDLIDDFEVGKVISETFLFAVIMAGGEGSRLRPLTTATPKSMIKVGNFPIIEHQIRNLSSMGIKQIFISINYLGEVIEKYFENGESFGVKIDYLREEKKRGTAGALSMLPQTPSTPILVMNGDIFTASDFNALFTYHKSTNSQLTIGAVDYRIEIPFGVITMEGENVREILEKPSQRYMCSAGIYAISPQALNMIPKVGVYNMTDLISSCLSKGMSVGAFPIHEYWTDIGTTDDLEKARLRFLQQEFNT